MNKCFNNLPHLNESSDVILNCDEEIKIFQKCLSELVHASQCDHNNECYATKTFFNHINAYTLLNDCTQKCFRSKILFNHWTRCQNNNCQLCWHVKKFVNQETSVVHNHMHHIHMPSTSSQSFNIHHTRMCRKYPRDEKTPYRCKSCTCIRHQIATTKQHNRLIPTLQKDATKIHHEDKADWIQYTNNLDKGFLVEGGKTREGEISYVGRGYYKGHLIPTAVIPSYNTTSIIIIISLNGAVRYLKNVEALIIANFEWKKVEYGRIPSNAIFGGIFKEDIQYIGRAWYNQAMHIGRISKESGCLHISFRLKEISIQTYEVLVDKNNDDDTLSESDNTSQHSSSAIPSTSKKTNGNECTICYRSPVVGIFKECMHACLCTDCIDIVNRKKDRNGKVVCPICRKLSDKAEKFFMS